MARLRCGFGAADITPAKRCELAGYGPDLRRVWDDILDPLFVRVLVLERGGARLIIAAFDVLGFTPAWARRFKGLVSQMTRTPAPHILLAATHTHSAPAAQPLRHWGEQVRGTLPRMEKGFLKALRKARKTLRPVVDVTERVARASTLLFNRDAFANEVAPEERTDPYVRALVFRSRGVTRALLSFGCHPVVLGPNYAVSADYPGALLRELAGVGVEGLFLLGAHGDVDPIVQTRKGWGRGTHQDVARMGRALARRFARSRTRPVPLEGFRIAGREWNVRLPLDVPLLAELERLEKEARAKRQAEPGHPGCRHNRREGSDRRGRRPHLMVEWAREAQAAVRSGKARPTQRITLQVLQVGPTSIVGIPMEVYAGVAARLRQARTHRALWVVSGANGTVNYLPTRLAYERGAYSAHFAPKIYGLLGYRPEVADVVTDSVLTHLDAG